MSDLIWLSEAQMRQIEPHFPLSHGVSRVDDRRVISGGGADLKAPLMPLHQWNVGGGEADFKAPSAQSVVGMSA